MCLAALRPDAVILLKGSDSAARQAAERRGLTIIEATSSKEGTLGFSIFESQTRSAAAPGESDEPDPDAPAFILQTSGTAAEPKLIPFSHRNMLAAAARIQAWFNLTPQDRCLSVSPPFYSHGLKVTVFTPLLTGGTVAFPTDASKFDYAEWFEPSEAHLVFGGSNAPSFDLRSNAVQSGCKDGTFVALYLVRWRAAPAECSGGSARNARRSCRGALWLQRGSTDCCESAARLVVPSLAHAAFLGRIPLMIVGEDGRPAPSGEQGEILVGGPTLISGYLNAPELNRASFINGWFKTGDIGSLDEDGFLTLHGRKNDVINRGGEKISPVEIDDALMRHPAVAEAAAFSVPHSRLGEDVAAAVVLRAGMTATPLELRRYLQDKVASFKVPRQIIIRDQLPKGKTGKVLRRRLTESLQENAVADSPIAAEPAVSTASVDGNLHAQIAEIWERLLNSASLSLDDDFFEKGGNSLLATQMLLELERLTGRTISSSILFEAPTIRQLGLKLSNRIIFDRRLSFKCLRVAIVRHYSISMGTTMEVVITLRG